jgi:hypothetical protein
MYNKTQIHNNFNFKIKVYFVCIFVPVCVRDIREKLTRK